jgi:DNA sulfur modification protein DndB
MNGALKKLQKIDWSRNNAENWQGRTIRDDGKVMNSEEAVTLTCSKIKQLLGLPLGKDEQTKETQR